MHKKDLKRQISVRKLQCQSDQIKALETELEEKSAKLKKYEELFGASLSGRDIEATMKECGETIYRGKRADSIVNRLLNSDIDKPVLEDINMENCLRGALKKEEFRIYYQPIVAVDNEKIIGMEALLRWHNPNLVMVYPNDFISLAEKTGLILPMGEWVLRTACLQIKAWQDAGYPSLKLAVNISPIQLQHIDFVPTVEKILRETQFNSSHLELEITESVVLSNLDYVANIIDRLKEMGITISIDDFGTGYSSLVYINRLAVNSLKIDQSFIRDLDINPSSKAIISATMAMAYDLNIEVTAEGVERKEQLSFLKQHRCHYFQGYLYSPPVPAEEFEEILRSCKQ